MNTRILLAAVAIAAAAVSGVARADEADASQYVIKFQGTLDRAQVQAEAARVSATRSNEPAGSRVIEPMRSTVEVKQVRAQAAEALRLGKIPHGEFSL